jgi:hypothetical protein
MYEPMVFTMGLDDPQKTQQLKMVTQGEEKIELIVLKKLAEKVKEKYILLPDLHGHIRRQIFPDGTSDPRYPDSGSTHPF